MNSNRVSTRRQPARKTLSAKLFNKGKVKKHRASAAAPMPMDSDGDESSFSRSLTIIFAIHVVALAMIFIHMQYLSDRTDDPVVAVTDSIDGRAARTSLPVLSDGTQPYMVRTGDTFEALATHFSVSESDLRNANKEAKTLKSGLVLRIPERKEVVVLPNVQPIPIVGKTSVVSVSDRGLVPVSPVAATTAAVSQPLAVKPPVAIPVRIHKVQSGETIWRIARKYNVSESELLKLNGISDVGKLRIGQVLNLPAN